MISVARLGIIRQTTLTQHPVMQSHSGLNRDRGLAFFTATGAIMVRSLAGKGTTKASLMVMFWEASGFPDVSRVEGPTFLTISVLLPRTVDELRTFIQEKGNLLMVQSRREKIGMSGDQA